MNSQTIASYMFSYNNYSVHIHLFDTNKYILTIIIASSIDDISSYDLSYGTFKAIENKIILKDKINDSEITLLKDVNDLIVDRGLDCFNNESFIYTNNLFSFSDQYKKLDSVRNVNFIIIDDINEVSQLKEGNYINQNKYNITIKPNNLYEFKINNVVISKGTYSINSNIINFYDNSLRHIFKAIIDEKQIVNPNLPGCSFTISKYNFERN